jgi:hypothetical protein
MLWRMTITLLAATMSVPLATAQTRGAGGRGFAPQGGLSRGGAHGYGLRHGTRPFPGGDLLGLPFYSDYDLVEPYPAEGVSFPLAAVQHAATEETPRKIKPLLIEWQGDRYVRFGGPEETDGTTVHGDYAGPAIPPASAAQSEHASTQAAELPPAVLVYRDGHREEIADYAIADGVIYVRGDYWQSGSWSKHIPLSAIDPIATMQANQQRGSKFMLPTASNVVVASF